MYKIDHFGSLIRLSDLSCIPMDSGNADYQEYLKWVSDGGVAETEEGPDPSALVQAQLDELEKVTLMNRLTREFMLVSMQDMANRQSQALAAQKIIKSPQQILADSIGWQKLVELNNQASQLREQL